MAGFKGSIVMVEIQGGIVVKMGRGSKAGRLMLAVVRGADRVSQGFDAVFGEDRTRPGDGFSKERAGKRAEAFTKDARKNNRDKVSGFLDDGKNDFFGKSDDKNNDNDTRFF